MKMFSQSFFLTLCLSYTSIIHSQAKFKANGESKLSLDINICNNWQTVENPILSQDGNYVIFIIKNKPEGKSTTVVRSIKYKWTKEIVNAKQTSFISNDCKVAYVTPEDTLSILTLNNLHVQNIQDVTSFDILGKDSDEWLIYQPKDSSKDLVTYNSSSAKRKCFHDVIKYQITKDRSAIILEKQPDSNEKKYSLTFVRLPELKEITFWTGFSPSELVFDEFGNKMSFTSGDETTGKSLWLYYAGTDTAELLMSNQAIKNATRLKTSYTISFSKDEQRLFIALDENQNSRQKDNSAEIDVWSYNDSQLQSLQLDHIKYGSRKYIAIVDIVKKKITVLERDGDEIFSLNPALDFAVVKTGTLSENYWNRNTEVFVCSLIDGQRIQLPIDGENVSPSGRYIIGNKQNNQSDLFSYDVIQKKIIDLTSMLKGTYSNGVLPPSYKNKLIETAAWLKDESEILGYDGHDIWLIDLNGLKKCLNLTNFYGVKNHIIFRLTEVYNGLDLANGDKIIINGFNEITKEDGLYQIQVGKNEYPKVLTKGAFKYEIPNISFNRSQAQSGEISKCLVKRESLKQSPNYFLTSDFSSFIPVTEVYPEKNYHWFTAELVSWVSLDGQHLQGVLYRPENFDRNRKHPVLIHYYEKKSDEINNYHAPHPIGDNINIPLLIARGYLVFTPDIKYKWGAVGESAYNAVVSSARYLSKLSFIDKQRIGIQGHSFGSYETNFIVTHSNLFAAAMSSCGSTDLLSHYGAIINGRSAAPFYERGQARMGTTLWESPKEYIEGSPIIQAHRVSTPILMMANKNDNWNFSNQLELFLGLRRTGKRAWLLQYDNGGHGVDGTDALDLTTRMLQFFDHYLKDSACPRWMMYGIPAKDKGIDNGYELVKEKDPITGKWVTPQEGGLLTDEEKKKVEALKHRKPVTVTIE